MFDFSLYCSYSKKKIIIIIFLHGLGRLTCSGIDALPSFPWESTISSSSRFVVEGVSAVWCCPLSQGGWSSFVCIWFLHLVFQGSPVLFLWFRFLFCLYMVLTSFIPGISYSFLMISLLVLFVYGSYILYSRDLQFFSYDFASCSVCIWFLHLVFQGSPVLFLWFRFLFCLYMVLTR